MSSNTRSLKALDVMADNGLGRLHSGSDLGAVITARGPRPAARQTMHVEVAAEDRGQIKARGAHYTPPELASFLAWNVIRHIEPSDGAIRVLDPACGDGSLLFAIAAAAPPLMRERLHLVGFDTHAQAIEESRHTLAGLRVAAVELKHADFLVDGPWRPAQGLLLTDPTTGPGNSLPAFNAVIANPPYVRTQVLGAAKAQVLARRFGLSGRVDLYHAFLKGIALSLSNSGVLGLLTSNRFLVTQAGAAMRESLIKDFDLLHIIDLGDTKLFSAAVLPAIAIARRGVSRSPGVTTFTRVYESRGGEPRSGAAVHPSVLDALKNEAEGMVQVGQACFKIETGGLRSSSASQPWVLTSERTDDWTQTVALKTSCTFGDVARIRVGIKSTADPVFIRTDWESLPAALRPEPALLRPLITHRVAAPWLAKADREHWVLYTHTMEGGKRVPVNLLKYPRARAYLESHREQLESRKYVIAAGRRWYEIWVPQQPNDWAHRKIVFPDISETPRFFLDDLGAIVNGDCYWITLLPGKSESWLFLMMAIANSRFIERYYDTMFNNRLYAGRRRFLTQYVDRFPLPDLTSLAAQEVISLAKERIDCGLAHSTRSRNIEDRLDRLIPSLFGLRKEVDRQWDLQLSV